MRHIKKVKLCQDFDNYVKETGLDKYLDEYIKDSSLRVKPWKKLTQDNGIVQEKGVRAKGKLAKHLYEEQKGLCIYCQQSFHNVIDDRNLSDISHIEHIKPKSRKKYPEDTFNQNNLALSCNGFDCNVFENEKKEQFCGHKRDDKFRTTLFLNPVEIEEIEQYFKYNLEGEISIPEELENNKKKKSQYMIELLDLNHKELIIMRKNTYDNYIKYHENEIDEFLDENVEVLPSFFSMLKQLLIKK